jgi:hypothetical protein
MYGFERELKPAGELFSREDGLEALRDAEYCYSIGSRFLEEWFNKG